MSKILTDSELLIALDCIATKEGDWEQDELKVIESHRTLQRRVEWTTERPTEAGYYWWRLSKDDTKYQRIYHVERLRFWGDTTALVIREGSRMDPLEQMNGEWQKVEPPHEARG